MLFACLAVDAFNVNLVVFFLLKHHTRALYKQEERHKAETVLNEY